jgi:hypothetical protein
LKSLPDCCYCYYGFVDRASAPTNEKINVKIHENKKWKLMAIKKENTFSIFIDLSSIELILINRY